jgi:glycosyltransferase involved in cell wall biosynthesis
MPGPAIRLIVPGNVRHNSGGNVYNAALVRGLKGSGADVEVRAVDGDWPVGTADERRRLARVLLDEAGSGAGEPPTPGAAVTIVDGLLGCGAPDELEAAAAAGCPVWLLVHMPLVGHEGLEGRALAAAAGVICTSRSAAAQLRTRHAMDRISMDAVRVALPGTDPAPAAEGSDPPHLVAIAALLPNKNQLLLLRALARITDLPWTAALVGSDSADPGYAAQVRSLVERLGLGRRVSVPGELSGSALEAQWRQANLSLLISQAETYGMVVTESLARGIPVVVRAGTGAVEALAAGETLTDLGDEDGAGGAGRRMLPGRAVALDSDPGPLAGELRRWLTEPERRERWRTAALDARGHLSGWDTTARSVMEIIGIDSARRSADGQ